VYAPRLVLSSSPSPVGGLGRPKSTRARRVGLQRGSRRARPGLLWTAAAGSTAVAARPRPAWIGPAKYAFTQFPPTVRNPAMPRRLTTTTPASRHNREDYACAGRSPELESLGGLRYGPVPYDVPKAEVPPQRPPRSRMASGDTMIKTRPDRPEQPKIGREDDTMADSPHRAHDRRPLRGDRAHRAGGMATVTRHRHAADREGGAQGHASELASGRGIGRRFIGEAKSWRGCAPERWSP